MARKTGGRFTMVSDLVGRIEFSLRAGKAGEKGYIPKTDGFIIEVVYKDAAERMERALSHSAIAASGHIKRYHAEHGRFPFKPGEVKRVNGDGSFVLPASTYVEKVEENLRKGLVGLEEKIRLAQSMGLEVPESWLEQLEAEDGSLDEGEEENAPEALPRPSNGFRYKEDQLKSLNDQKLRQLCQDEQFEGYGEMTRDEMIEELSEVAA